MEPNDDQRSEEHTSELQSPCNLVCRLLLENITDPDLVSPILHPFSYHLAVGRGPHANQHRRRHCLREHLGVPRSMHQLLFPVLFFNDTAPTEIYPLSLHDALPISLPRTFNHKDRLWASMGWKTRIRPMPS